YYYSEGWRPILPLTFVKAYPKLNALIQECWRVRRKERPNFDQIVARLQGDIGDEIKRKEEPKIELYSKEDDEVYRNRIGKEDELEDSDEEEIGTKRGDVVSKAEHDKVVAAKDQAMAELRVRVETMEEKERKGETVGKAEHEQVVAAKDQAMAELRVRVETMEEKERKGETVGKAEHEQVVAAKDEAIIALAEKTAEERAWGAALRELSVASPEDLLEHAKAHRHVLEELERRGGGGNANIE
ncbi:hypothetical protein TeGR_g7622, partial [Tetraparma gracilis]